jgi:hypothetical protein
MFNSTLGRGGGYPSKRFGDRPSLTDDDDVVGRLEQRTEAGSDDFMVIQEENAQAHEIIISIASQ